MEDNLLTVINNEDLSLVDTNELLKLSEKISGSISLTKLRRSVDLAIKNLSGVGDPSFGADLEMIALDNQERLRLIWFLVDRLNNIEANIKSLKKNRYNCKENPDFLYRFTDQTKELLETTKE